MVAPAAPFRTRIPLVALAETTLRSAAVVPPMVALVELLTTTPLPPFPRAVAPVTSRPTTLPWMVPMFALFWTTMPSVVLPETALPAPAAVPPMMAVRDCRRRPGLFARAAPRWRRCRRSCPGPLTGRAAGDEDARWRRSRR